ncbi:eukaryotic translation initiation factor 3 subunit M-like [Macadamia integrifolia]|uniref:eukaryotic translation initiation factor 3 subunit M-like n=1 Tax=Macadamia integrifolia TaxID=60698 RepID=UPI001C4FD434|nr:eukaryotic translation initiation factor 3 subunit M-like [Macadamia integrifolia]
MAKLISTKVTQQANNKPALRLKILFNLYNLLENPYGKFYVYMKALNLAVNGKVTDDIIPSFKKVDSFIKEWNIGTLDQRELFPTISNILKEHKSSAKDSFYFLTKYLATFSGEDAYTMSEAKEEAVRAIVEFVKAPEMFQSDLFEMPAVGQLDKDGKYALLYQLLKIFLTHRLGAYLDFHAANSDILKSFGLAHEDCITKMRLMTLADLGSNHGEIPYGLIKDTLWALFVPYFFGYTIFSNFIVIEVQILFQVNDDEVEVWVVKAIAAKLLNCKMDQMNQVVIVNRCTERVFGLHQWFTVRSKLTTWRGNVANVINTIQANKGTEDATQAVHSLMIR